MRTAHPAPEIRDQLERRGWREYPADIRVRVRRYYRDQEDFIMVEINGDVGYFYTPTTSQKQDSKLIAKPKPKKRRSKK